MKQFQKWIKSFASSGQCSKANWNLQFSVIVITCSHADNYSLLIFFSIFSFYRSEIFFQTLTFKCFELFKKWIQRKKWKAGFSFTTRTRKSLKVSWLVFLRLLPHVPEMFNSKMHLCQKNWEFWIKVKIEKRLKL